MKNMRKTTWLDVIFSKYNWYRKLIGGTWYQKQYTQEASELTFSPGQTWWSKNNIENRYSKIINQITYNDK